uniref:3'-5' exodeoxyribonuclease n=1 Tax=Panagrolaimus davidi TaxID=227884 RepID=A0A914QKH0_9BILA
MRIYNSGVTVRLFGSTYDGFSACGFARSTYGLTADIEHVVTGLEIVSGTSLYGYKEGDGTQNFFKIYVVSPRIITGFGKALSRGVSLCGVQPEGLKCHEANIDFEVRFMVDTNLVGCGWVELPPKKYRVYNDYARTTLCQIEVGSFIATIFYLY